ncbi:MAG: hypothetical protein U0892_18275 [Pirellulales bacterium]
MCLILIGAISLIPGIVSAQNSKQRDRRDEQKENERVKNAEKELRDAKQGMSSALKEYREAAQKVDQLRRKRDTSEQEWKRKREAVEEGLLESSGIPAVLREMRDTRALLDAASKPIQEAFMASEKWKTADAAAQEAKKKRAELIEGNDSSRGDDDTSAITEALDKLEAVIEEPQKLLSAELDKDPKVHGLSEKLSALQKQNETLRKKLGPSPADKDPDVKRAAQSLDEAEKKLAAAVKEQVNTRSQLQKKQTAVNSASQQLSKAQAADRNDANKPKRKK